MIFNRPEQDRGQLESFTNILQTDPNVARQILKMKPYIGHLLIAGMESILRQKDAGNRNIPNLFHRYLDPIAQDATVLCLGTGTGIELPQVRKVVSHGRIIGIDNSNNPLDTVSSVINEFRANAEFYPWDLNQMSVEEIVDRLGEMPQIILCRHPNVYSNFNWIILLAKWAQAANRKSRQLLVTTFDRREVTPIVDAIKLIGLSPVEDMWPDGDVIVDKQSGERAVQDRYIAGININK